MQLYLASRSPQRLKLLRDAGYDVEVVAGDVTEPPLEAFPSAYSYVLCAACLKAAEARDCGDSGMVVAADTLALVGRHAMGKPADRAEAERMLRTLSGSAQQVVTGLCLCTLPEAGYLAAVEKTNLRMRHWSDAEISAYLDRGHWEGKAGAYAIEPVADPFVEELDGSLSNVIGLPLERLEVLLKRQGSVR